MTYKVKVSTPDGEEFDVTIHNDRVSEAVECETGEVYDWDELPFLIQTRVLAHIHGDIELEVVR